MLVKLSSKVREMILSQMPKEVKKRLPRFQDPDGKSPVWRVWVNEFSRKGKDWEVKTDIFPPMPTFVSGEDIPHQTGWPVKLPSSVKFLMLIPVNNSIKSSGEIEYLAITNSELKELGEENIRFPKVKRR